MHPPERTLPRLFWAAVKRAPPYYRAKLWSLSRRQLDGFDASWVAPRLWVGAYPGNGPEMLARTKAVGIDRVVRCANQEWHEFDVGIDTADLDADRIAAFERASNAVAAHLRRRLRVLVTCQAGINRSALVAGLALVKTYGTAAMPPTSRSAIQPSPNTSHGPPDRVGWARCCASTPTSPTGFPHDPSTSRPRSLCVAPLDGLWSQGVPRATEMLEWRR